MWKWVSVCPAINKMIFSGHIKDPRVICLFTVHLIVCLFICVTDTALQLRHFFYPALLICSVLFLLCRLSMPTQTPLKWSWTGSLSLSWLDLSESDHRLGGMALLCALSFMVVRSQVCTIASVRLGTIHNIHNLKILFVFFLQTFGVKYSSLLTKWLLW